MAAPKITPPLRLMLDIPALEAETRSLSAAVLGALIRMKAHVWRSGSLLDDDEVLARIAGMDSKDWRKARKSLEPLFVVRHGEWQREDWNDELEAAYEAINKASRAGRAAVTARWSRQKQQSESYESNTDRMRSVSDANTPSILNNKAPLDQQPQPKPNPKTPRPGANDFQPDFEADVEIAERALGIGGGV